MHIHGIGQSKCDYNINSMHNEVKSKENCIIPFSGNGNCEKNPIRQLLEGNNKSPSKLISHAGFIGLPPELINMILKALKELYLSAASQEYDLPQAHKKYAQQLSGLARVNKQLFSHVMPIRHEIFHSEFMSLLIKSLQKFLPEKKSDAVKISGLLSFNLAKKMISENLRNDNIGLEDPKNQSEWCKNTIIEIAKKTEFGRSQVKFGIDYIINKIQHLSFDFDSSLSDSIHFNNIMDMIFSSILKKNNIKTFKMPLNEKINYKRLMAVLRFILRKNPELTDISYVHINSNLLELNSIQDLLQLLSGKNVDTLSLEGNWNKGLILKYLKNINIVNLKI